MGLQSLDLGLDLPSLRLMLTLALLSLCSVWMSTAQQFEGPLQGDESPCNAILPKPMLEMGRTGHPKLIPETNEEKKKAGITHRVEGLAKDKDPCKIIKEYAECFVRSRTGKIPAEESNLAVEEFTKWKPSLAKLGCLINFQAQIASWNKGFRPGRLPLHMCVKPTYNKADDECWNAEECLLRVLPMRFYFEEELDRFERQVRDSPFTRALPCMVQIRERITSRNNAIAAPTFIAKDRCWNDYLMHELKEARNDAKIPSCDVFEKTFDCILKAQPTNDVNATFYETQFEDLAKHQEAVCQFNFLEKALGNKAIQMARMAANPQIKKRADCQRIFSNRLALIEKPEERKTCDLIQDLLTCEIHASTEEELSDEENIALWDRTFKRAEKTYGVDCFMTVRGMVYSLRASNTACSTVAMGMPMVANVLLLLFACLRAHGW